MGGCVATASRRSHAATKGSRLSMSCGFRGAGPISWNPLQAAKQRSCGYNMIPHPYRSPKGDWRIHYDVENDSRSRFAEPRDAYPTAALLRSLQWVSERYVSPRDTALTGCSAMVGCGATAKRHSLLGLHWLLDIRLIRFLNISRTQPQ